VRFTDLGCLLSSEDTVFNEQQVRIEKEEWFQYREEVVKEGWSDTGMLWELRFTLRSIAECADELSDPSQRVRSTFLLDPAGH
jgi:hypothetical protein